MEEKPKKPFYKRVWFWVIVVLFIIPEATTIVSSIVDTIDDKLFPAERMINEERAAEQAALMEEVSQEENAPVPENAEQAALDSVEQLISDTFRGSHYSCKIEPYEGDFGYAAIVVVDVPESYADDPDTILTGLGNTIASQSQSQVVWLELKGYYNDEIVFDDSGPFNKRLDIDDFEDTSSNGTEQTVTYIVNTNTKVFHKSTCSRIDSIKSENKSSFSGSRTGAINAGYSPCSHCNP